MRLTRVHLEIDPASIRLPIIALVDVVLFLLLYFMIAGSLAREEADLTAAVQAMASEGARGADLTNQVVSVEVEGREVRFRLGARTLRDRAQLESALAGLPKDIGVTVRADDDVPVDAVAAALQACHDAGFEKIGFGAAR